MHTTMKGMFQETSPDILVIFWSACRARAINFQPRGADSTHEGVREEETSAEVRGVAQDREGGGAVEGGCGKGCWDVRGRLWVVLLWRCLGL